ncbi:hypothetical protein BD309DRAFT_1003190 [Dichomitus squalens]|nr:hypothetical protein BD309DRAFT_1003190 [Dichomitus squalens]
MALAVHPPPPGDGPRRSTRIRVRRQTTLSRSSYLLTHTQTAVTRRPPISRSPQGADPSVIVASFTRQSKSGVHAASNHPSRKRHSYQHTRIRVSSSHTSTASSSSSGNSKLSARKQISLLVPHPDSATPVLAGTKRKRSQNPADPVDRLAYQLVSVDKHGDSVFQTPRQLRYAKRQRLLTSLSDNESLAAREPPAGRQRGTHRATTEGRLLSAVAPATPRPSESPASDERLRPDRPPTPRPKTPAHLVPDVVPNTEVAPLPAPSFTERPAHSVAPNTEPEEAAEPTICPFHRLKLPHRERRPDTADTGLWKLACQERVEYLKDTYREIYEAVIHAEALTAQRLYPQAPSTASDSDVPPSPVASTAQFTLYTPSSCAAAARVDADGDTDMDAGYSSDWDSDEDEEEKSEAEDDDLLFDAHAQTHDDGLHPLDDDGGAHTGWSPGAQAFGGPPRLPRLATVPVYALECVPEQTARNGVPFMGRGTPVDRARRADWAAPAVALLPLSRAMDFAYQPWLRQATPVQVASPPQEFYAPHPQTQMLYPDMGLGFDPMQMQIDVQAPMPVSVPLPMQMQYAHAECMPWLDPALRAESSSPSPSPAPPTPTPAYALPLSLPQQQDFTMALPEYPSTPSLGTSPSPGVSLSPSLPSTPASPTGCAWHASFLQCLQSPTGCAPCFPPASSIASIAYAGPASPTPQHCAPFAAQAQTLELAEFAPPRLVEGSVTLGHALG